MSAPGSFSLENQIENLILHMHAEDEFKGGAMESTQVVLGLYLLTQQVKRLADLAERLLVP